MSKAAGLHQPGLVPAVLGPAGAGHDKAAVRGHHPCHVSVVVDEGSVEPVLAMVLASNGRPGFSGDPREQGAMPPQGAALAFCPNFLAGEAIHHQHRGHARASERGHDVVAEATNRPRGCAAARALSQPESQAEGEHLGALPQGRSLPAAAFSRFPRRPKQGRGVEGRNEARQVFEQRPAHLEPGRLFAGGDGCETPARVDDPIDFGGTHFALLAPGGHDGDEQQRQRVAAPELGLRLAVTDKGDERLRKPGLLGD